MYCVMLADGFEEIEAITTIDIMRRANIDVVTVGVSGKTVMGAHNIPVVADKVSDEIDTGDIDGVILPGGMPGTTNLLKSDFVDKALKVCSEKGGLLCAICAAPMVLGNKGYLKGKCAVCYPGFEDELIGADVQYTPVAKDGNIITSRGAGTASDFAFCIVKKITQKDTKELYGSMIYG